MNPYRDRRNCNWFWMDNNFLRGWGKTLGPSAIAVYSCLCMFASEEHGTCYPSITKMADMLGITRQTVITAIKKLEECGMIDVEHGIGETHPNVYTVNPLPSALQDSLKIQSRWSNNSTQIVKPLDSNNTNITIPINNSDALETQTPNKVLKQSGAVEPQNALKESSPHPEVIAYFVNAYQVSKGQKYHFMPKDAAQIAQLLKVTDKAEIMKRIDRLFASSNKWIKESAYTVGVLFACFNQLTTDIKPVTGGASGRQL